MRQSNSYSLFCPVCSSKHQILLPYHSIQYGFCKSCQHTYLFGGKISSDKNAATFAEKTIRSKGEILGRRLSANFHRRLRPLNDIKSEFLLPYSNKNLSVLDAAYDIGSLFLAHPNLKYAFSEFSGLEKRVVFADNDTEFERETKPLSSAYSNRKFDIVLMVNYLEYEYCIYSRIIEAIERLSENGNICVAVPLNNNPQSNYLARSHEFSEKSFNKFLEALTVPFESCVSDGFGKAVITISDLSKEDQGQA